MNTIRFFTDEDVYAAVASALRRSGVDAISTPEAGRLSQTDDAQLEWAAKENRAILTFNVSHFANLHTNWMQSGRHHAGIIVSSQKGVGEVIRRMLQLANSLEADDMC